MSELSSQPPAVEKPEAPKSSLKQRFTSRFKKNPDNTPRETLEEMAGENKSDVNDQGLESPQEANTPFIEGNTPEERYEQILKLASPPQNGLDSLKKKVAEKKVSDNMPIPERIFFARDRLRHKALETYARVSGVKDIDAFNEMVITLEKSMIKTEYKYLNLNHEPSEQEKEKIIAEWSKKGYYVRKGDFRPSYDDENLYTVSFSRSVPVNIERGDIPVLKEFLSSGENPSKALIALQKVGVNIYSLYPESEEIAKIVKLLTVSGTPEALTFLKNVADLPGVKHVSTLDMNTLQQILASENIQSYDDDFFQKVAVLSPLMGTGIIQSNLVEYKAIVENPDKYRFVTSFLQNGYDGGISSGDRIFTLVKQLESKGLLKPLTACIDAQSSLGLRDYERLLDTGVENIKDFLQKPETIDLINSPEKQAFSRLLNYMDGKRPDPSQVEKLFDKRVDIVNAYSILSTVGIIDKDSLRRFYSNASIKIYELIRKPGVENGLRDLEIRTFLQDLKKQGVIFPTIADYNVDVVGQVVELFNFKHIAGELGDDIYETAKKLAGSDVNIRRDAERHISRYKYLDENKTLINKLKDLQIFSSPSEYYNYNTLEKLKSAPFLGETILSQIPQEMRAQWIKDSLSLSASQQVEFLVSFGMKYGYVENSTEPLQINFEKVHKIAQIFESVGIDGYELTNVLIEYKGDLKDLTQDGRPTKQFADLLITNRCYDTLSDDQFDPLLPTVIKENISLLKRIDYRTKQFLRYDPNFPNLTEDVLKKYNTLSDISQARGEINFSIKNLIMEYEGDPIDLFDGKPTKLLIDTLISKRLTDDLSNFLSDETINYYEGSMKDMLQLWKGMPVSLREEILIEEPDFPSVSDKNVEKYRTAGKVIERIQQSPSAEIKRLQTELINQLWKLDDPMTALEEVIGVFEKNNLPLVGKTYRVFETIYDNPNTPGGTILEKTLASESNLSPVLKEADPKQRREIIYRDLLKVHVDSGNPQLRDYLEVLQSGEGLIGKIDTDGVESLSERERIQFTHFLNKMDMLYQSSLLGRTMENRYREKGIDHIPTTSHLDIKDRVQALKKNFRVGNGRRLTDRVSEMFLKPLGHDRAEEVLEQMGKSKSEADRRNRESVSGNDSFTVQARDRFKGVQSSVLLKILESGSVAREYLGSEAGSDYTPYDTDTSVILPSDIESNGFQGAVQNTLSASYGDIMLLIRDRGQFGTGRNQYESFGSVVLGERHEGIRTGIASTEIDGIVLNTYSQDKTDDLFITIAQNGFYIPVSDRDGKIIFTPQDFDTCRKVFDGVSEYNGNPMRVNRVGINEGSYTFPNSTEVISGTRSVLDTLIEDIRLEKERINGISDQVRESISSTLLKQEVKLRGEFDASIYGAELIDTGSTSRGTNVPGEQIDFDLSLQLDPNDSKRLQEIAQSVKETLKLQEDKSHGGQDYVQIRAIGSGVIEGESLDIDVGIGRRADYGIFASSDAVSQKLSDIKERMGDSVYEDVLANIVLAKKVLKEGGAYKKLEDGGMGGIGIENWILSNNGNILDAFQSFWNVAHENGEAISYDEFAKRYKVFDAGTNIKYNTHDNFIQILKPNGYQKMVEVIGQYLGYV